MLNLGVGVDLGGTLEVSQSALGIAAHQRISTWLQLAARSNSRTAGEEHG